jgi:hypothetical protein
MRKLNIILIILLLSANCFSQVTISTSSLYVGELPYKFQCYDGIPIDTIPCSNSNQKFVKHGNYRSYHSLHKRTRKDPSNPKFIREIGQYHFDKKYGEWTEYYAPKFIHDQIIQGTIKSKGHYFHDFLIGEWLYYDKKGIVRKENHTLKYDNKIWQEKIKGFSLISDNSETIDYLYNINFIILSYFEIDSVTVTYKIESDNTITDYKVINGIGYGYDDYALLLSIHERFIFDNVSYDQKVTDTVIFTFNLNSGYPCNINVSTESKRKRKEIN